MLAPGRSALAAALVIAATVTAAAAPAVPVVVAVDTSRSLRPADLARTRAAAGRLVDALAPGAPVALLAFDDTPAWLARPGASRSAMDAALARLKLGGRYTLLNDALFTAARALEDGGVILVITDGRDENSATTVDDVARVCAANHVRIVTAAAGRRPDTRSLRRLALVTGGRYLGRLSRVSPADLTAAVSGARDSVAAKLEKSRPQIAPTPVPATPAPPAASAARTAPGHIPGWVPWAVAAVVVVLLAVLLLARRRTPRTRRCERCGAELQPWEDTCPHCQVRDLEEAMRTQRVAAPPESEEAALDPGVFEKQPLPAGLEQTLVLKEKPVLAVKQRGRTARTYALPTDEVFAVGRAPGVNSLQIDDPTVSAQHFKIVPKDGEFYVVDLETTNGTAVNDQRVRVRRLKPGDVIRAGAVELTFKTVLNRAG